MYRGPFEGLVEQFTSPDFLLSRASASARLLQRGQAPPGMRTFALPLNSNLEMLLLGHRVGANDLLLFPASGELEAANTLGFHMLTFSIAPALLRQACSKTPSNPILNHKRRP